MEAGSGRGAAAAAGGERAACGDRGDKGNGRSAGLGRCGAGRREVGCYIKGLGAFFFGVCGVVLREGRSSFVFVVCFCCCKVKRNGTRRGLCHKLNQNQKKIGTKKWCVFEVER